MHSRIRSERDPMKTVILAGGLGSRLAEETVIRPKPMVEIGGRPMLWHIMNLYAAQGFRDFVVACGYKGEVIKEYFSSFHLQNADLSIDLREGRLEMHNNRGPDWRVTLVDTGLMTSTGGRVRRLRRWLGEETFLLTYGDGVGDIDLRAILDFHRRHGKLATLTAVHPPARFGGLEFDGEQVVSFREKPQIGEGWINGGFMVLEPGVHDYIDGDDTLFEREPLERLAADGQLMAWRHEGFWQPMDTLREKHLLEELWTSGRAPWKVWSD
jgi:glucose-1-phosphate cytidylyltransferase